MALSKKLFFTTTVFALAMAAVLFFINILDVKALAGPPPPTIANIYPNPVTAGGGDFTLNVYSNSNDYQNGAQVGIDNVYQSATFNLDTVHNTTWLATTVSASNIATAGVRKITVKNPDGQISNFFTLTINPPPPPSVTSISSAPVGIMPSSPTCQSSIFTINGTDFVQGAVISLPSDGGVTFSTVYVSPTQLTTTSYYNAVTGSTHTLKVTNPDGQYNSTAFSFTCVNPIPTVSGTTPSLKTAGGSTFTLTVEGTNLNSSSTVKFNGMSMTTTYVNSTKLTATIPASFIAVAGQYGVNVFTSGPGGGTSNSVSFVVNPDIGNYVCPAGSPGVSVNVNSTTGTPLQINGPTGQYVVQIQSPVGGSDSSYIPYTWQNNTSVPPAPATVREHGGDLNMLGPNPGSPKAPIFAIGGSPSGLRVNNYDAYLGGGTNIDVNQSTYNDSRKYVADLARNSFAVTNIQTGDWLNFIVNSLKNYYDSNGNPIQGDYSLNTGGLYVAVCPFPSATLTVAKNLITHGRNSNDLVYFHGFIGSNSANFGTSYQLAPGSHVVSETIDSTVSAYYDKTIGGDCASNGNITLTAGQTKICLITNEEKPSQLIISKNVSGGNATSANFAPYKVDGNTTDNNGNQIILNTARVFNSGNHTVTETTNTNYTATFGGDCNASGVVTLAPNATKTCTITNTSSPPATHKECANQKCVSINGAGSDSCVVNNDCNSSTGNHTECSNLTCIVVNSPGSNKCSSNTDCVGISNNHTECANLSCVIINGAGTNQCSSSANCTGSNTHTVCANLTCLNINGAGTNECSTNSDCSSTNKHSVCSDNTCIIVNSAGTNECNTNSDCSGSTKHSVCSNLSCVVVSGAGTNACTSSSDCITQDNTHTVCASQSCVVVGGTGNNQCTNAGDCTGVDNVHSECANLTCVIIDGAGSNLCNTPQDCSGINNRHSICSNLTCIIDPTPGSNQCTSNAECSSNTPSTASGLTTENTSCTNTPGQGLIYFKWNYNDANGDNESQYQLQIATYGNNFSQGSIKVDRTISSSTSNGGVNQQLVTIQKNPGPDSIAYNTLYEWRVKVCDTYNACSGWINGGTYIQNGHPDPVSSFNFSPPSPIEGGTAVNFTSTSKCYDNNGQINCSYYIWNFGDGCSISGAHGAIIPGGGCASGTYNNPSHTFYTPGFFILSLAAYDGTIYCASPAGSTMTVFPAGTNSGAGQWKEFSPLSP